MIDFFKTRNEEWSKNNDFRSAQQAAIERVVANEPDLLQYLSRSLDQLAKERKKAIDGYVHPDNRHQLLVQLQVYEDIHDHIEALICERDRKAMGSQIEVPLTAGDTDEFWNVAPLPPPPKEDNDGVG